jgi:hypothetical protein
MRPAHTRTMRELSSKASITPTAADLELARPVPGCHASTKYQPLAYPSQGEAKFTSAPIVIPCDSQ